MMAWQHLQLYVKVFRGPQVGLRYGLELLSPVDDEGVFTAEAGPFAGAQRSLPASAPDS